MRSNKLENQKIFHFSSSVLFGNLHKFRMQQELFSMKKAYFLCFERLILYAVQGKTVDSPSL